MTLASSGENGRSAAPAGPPGSQRPPRSKGRWLRDLYGWHLTRRATRRPLTDVLGRSFNRRVRRLSVQEIVDQAASGYYCEAFFCRRGVTCVVFFEVMRRGQCLYGETYCCTSHGERRAARYHVRIQDPAQEGETR